MQNEDPMEVEMGSSGNEEDLNVDYQKKVSESFCLSNLIFQTIGIFG